MLWTTVAALRSSATLSGLMRAASTSPGTVECSEAANEHEVPSRAVIRQP